MLALGWFVPSFAALGQEAAKPRMLGMYVHQHWPYNNPYAARTWSVEQWRGYADGLKKLGFNAIMIWPVIETMPDPPTPSDIANLKKLEKVVDVLHKEFDFRVWITMCPNILARDEEARKATFTDRHYYYCEDLVNPSVPSEVAKLIGRREKVLKYLRNADAFVIIDSDPGGYPGSQNEEFVNLLSEHRKMMDRLRPGIELIYWMHAGWRGWNRLYETGKLDFFRPDELEDTLKRVRDANPAPWGVANGLEYAKKLGVFDRAAAFNYGRIEGEPSFPLTNWTGQVAYEGATSDAPRGVMGNAQTHCVQLPNTFAFARGFQHKPVTEADYVQFANDLIPGYGEQIVEAWKALPGLDAGEQREIAKQLDAFSRKRLKTGPLKGLLFGSPRRFLTDLAKMLRQRAALNDLVKATDSRQGVKAALAAFIEASEVWQGTHGYKNNWHDPRMHTAIRKLNHPAIDQVFQVRYGGEPPFDAGISSSYEQVRANFAKIETLTIQFMNAMKAALADME